MQTKGISARFLLIVSAALLVFTNVVTYVLLLSERKEWKSKLTETSINTSVVADGLTEHVYYDGDSIPCNQTVRHYSRSGKMTGSERLSDLLEGDRVLLLLSPNSCSSCTNSEIEKLLELGKKIGRERIVILADYAMHKEHSRSMPFDEEGYYETDMEHLGLKGSPTRETAVVMLTQDGRVKTSFCVGAQTIGYVNGFHDYLTDYFNRKK